jgi:hypothetical protein
MIVSGLVVKPSVRPVRQNRALSQPSVDTTPPFTEPTIETTASQPPAPRPSTAEIDKQDSYNNTQSFRRYIDQQQRERPAYQHLPYRGEEVHIEITNVTSDGRLELDVIPLGLNVNPRSAYARFLRRYHDPGRAYLAQYGRYQP